LQKSIELKDLKKNVNLTPFSRFLWGYKKWAVDSNGRYIVRGPNRKKPRVRCCPREVVCLPWYRRFVVRYPAVARDFYFFHYVQTSFGIFQTSCCMCILYTRYSISFGARHWPLTYIL
jgi:hypothetical protein